jgi:hypothetical protein
MSYETKVQIQLQVTDATGPLKQQETNTRVTEVRTKRLKFCSPKSRALKAGEPDFDPDCQKATTATVALKPPDAQEQPPSGGTIGFVSFSAAPAYQFKKCGKDYPGIFIRKTVPNLDPPDDADKQHQWYALTSALVLYGQAFHRLANVAESLAFEVYVCDELFDCAKTDAPPVIVTITYGFALPSQIYTSAHDPNQDSHCPHVPATKQSQKTVQQDDATPDAQTGMRRNGTMVPA